MAEESVYRVIDVVGTSSESWEDAARTAIETAAGSLRDLRVAEVTKLDVTVDDGKIARMTGTESEFGREFDSLADVLTMGMAPALAAWAWGLSELGRVGWLVPLFYVVCTATRLARFNVQTTRTDPRWFVGLPSPAAAGTIASFLLVRPDHTWRSWLIGAMAGGLVAIGALMVSTFRYSSLKSLDFRQRRSYRVALPIAGVVVLLAFWPELFFPGFAVAYALSGPLLWLFGRFSTPSRIEATHRLPPSSD